MNKKIFILIYMTRKEEVFIKSIKGLIKHNIEN